MQITQWQVEVSRDPDIPFMWIEFPFDEIFFINISQLEANNHFLGHINIIFRRVNEMDRSKVVFLSGSLISELEAE